MSRKRDNDNSFLSPEDIEFMLNSEYRHIRFAPYLSQESHSYFICVIVVIE